MTCHASWVEADKQGRTADRVVGVDVFDPNLRAGARTAKPQEAPHPGAQPAPQKRARGRTAVMAGRLVPSA